MARTARMALDIALATSKSMKPAIASAWQYAKVEVAPPMTLEYLHGPAGKKLEDYVSKSADGIIASIQGRIKEIEAEEARQIKEKEAAIQAAADKAKEAAKKKEEERKKEAEALKASAAKKAQEKKAKEKPKEDKKAEAPKAAAKKPNTPAKKEKKGDKKK